MRRSLLLPAIATLAVLILTASVQALPYWDTGVYQGYGKYEQGWWFTYQKWEVWVTVDTSADTVKVKWRGPSWLILPWAGRSWFTQVGVEDEKGWSGYKLTTYSGEKTFYGYRHSYTWVHVTVQWTYLLASPTPAFYNVFCHANVYVRG